MDHDLIVFGGGNAITVAIEAAKAGWRVALVEKGPLGGTCTNRGCIPSKLLIAYADAAEHVRDASRFHLDATLGAIDGDALLKETFTFTNAYDGLIEGSLPETLELHRGHGRFVDDRTIEVNGARLRAERIVLATGSRPRRPEIPGLDGTPYWTSDDVFRLERLPRSLTIVGGGYVGCELAHFFTGVGVETLVVQQGGELLSREDEETQAAFQTAFTARVPVRLDATVTAVVHDAAGFRVTIEGRDGTRDEHACESLLFAIGRVPSSDRIGIETTSLRPNENGYVESDDRLRTGVDGIWSLGDVAGRHFFTHVANFEAEWLARQLVEGRDDRIDYGAVPHAVFTHPEIAGVGATEQELRKRGVAYRSGVERFSRITKGRALKDEHGLAKILVDPAGAILGAHVVGTQASVLLHEVMAVMHLGGNVHDLAGLMHIHPSLPEVIRGAARKAAAALG